MCDYLKCCFYSLCTDLQPKGKYSNVWSLITPWWFWLAFLNSKIAGKRNGQWVIQSGIRAAFPCLPLSIQGWVSGYSSTFCRVVPCLSPIQSLSQHGSAKILEQEASPVWPCVILNSPWLCPAWRNNVDDNTEAELQQCWCKCLWPLLIPTYPFLCFNLCGPQRTRIQNALYHHLPSLGADWLKHSLKCFVGLFFVVFFFSKLVWFLSI